MARHRLLLRAVMAATPLVLFAACAQGPEYRHPGLPAGDWSVGSDQNGAAVDVTSWWRDFDDPILDRLIAAARAGNTEVRIARERVEEARAARAGAAAGYWPDVAATAAVNRRRLSENGALPAGRIPGIDVYQSIHQVGFDAGWEADVFGKTGSRVRAGDAVVGQRDAEAADALVVVTAEVARNYFELRGLQQRLDAARDTSAALAGRLALAETALRAGEITQAAVAGARQELAQARAVIPGLEAALLSRALALGVLTGAAPDAELALVDEGGRLPDLRAVPAGSRVDVLQRRPDIRAAERRLAASTYAADAAIASRFPRLVVSATGGFEALDADTLFDAASQTFSIVPALSWSLLNGGRTKAAVQESESRMRQAAIAYDTAVNGALLETERALSAYRSARQRLLLLADARAAAETAYGRAEKRHAAGDLRRSDLLETEVRLRAAIGEQVAAHADAAVALVALYKALGGGVPGTTDTGGLAARR